MCCLGVGNDHDSVEENSVAWGCWTSQTASGSASGLGGAAGLGPGGAVGVAAAVGVGRGGRAVVGGVGGCGDRWRAGSRRGCDRELLGAARSIPAGHVVTASDVRAVAVGGAEGVSVVPAEQAASVVGRAASVPVAAGALHPGGCRGRCGGAAAAGVGGGGEGGWAGRDAAAGGVQARRCTCTRPRPMGRRVWARAAGRGGTRSCWASIPGCRVSSRWCRCRSPTRTRRRWWRREPDRRSSWSRPAG